MAGLVEWVGVCRDTHFHLLVYQSILVSILSIEQINESAMLFSALNTSKNRVLKLTDDGGVRDLDGDLHKFQ